MSGSRTGGGDASEIPKNSVIDSSNATNPPVMPYGIARPNSSIPKLTTRLVTMATLAALAVARFQLKPMATVGTRAAAKVPQPNAPSNATRSCRE